MTKNNKKIIKHIISFTFIFLFLFFIFLPKTQAAGIVPEGSVTTEVNGKETTTDKKESGSYTLDDFTILLINVAEWILGISGSLALLAFVIGGIMFLTSAGSRERVDQAKKIISGAIIGLAIVFFSYTIINFVLTKIFNIEKWNGGKGVITNPKAIKYPPKTF